MQEQGHKDKAGIGFLLAEDRQAESTLTQAEEPQQTLHGDQGEFVLRAKEHVGN